MKLRALALVNVMMLGLAHGFSQTTQHDLQGIWLRDDGQRTSITQAGSTLTAVKLGGGYVPAGDVTWKGEYTANPFAGSGKLGNGKGETHWVQVRIAIVSSNKIRVTGPNFDRTYTRERVREFHDDNEAGIRLWTNASQQIGTAYDKRSMTCDQLVSRASDAAGIRIVTAQFHDGTVTKSWFDHGMGPEFRQIAGGDNGEPLARLTADEVSGRITIPIGAVIVANGHAALFDGEGNVGKRREMFLLDANDSEGWTISLNGEASRNDLQNKMIALPAHQVGYHATRLQWRTDTLVKVFRVIGH